MPQSRGGAGMRGMERKSAHTPGKQEESATVEAREGWGQLPQGG